MKWKSWVTTFTSETAIGDAELLSWMAIAPMVDIILIPTHSQRASSWPGTDE